MSTSQRKQEINLPLVIKRERKRHEKRILMLERLLADAHQSLADFEVLVFVADGMEGK